MNATHRVFGDVIRADSGPESSGRWMTRVRDVSTESEMRAWRKKKTNHVFALEIETKAEEKPDFKALTFENGDCPDESLTYAEIVTNGRKVLKLFQESGIRRGDTFCVVMRNHPEFVYSLYAASALGAIMVPVDPRIKADRLEFLIKNSKSKGIIVSREFIENTKDLLKHLPHVKVIGVV